MPRKKPPPNSLLAPVSGVSFNRADPLFRACLFYAVAQPGAGALYDLCNTDRNGSNVPTWLGSPIGLTVRGCQFANGDTLDLGLVSPPFTVFARFFQNF